MARRGFFVSFEGIDGSGKTTQISKLADTLRSMGLAPVLAQEPGGTPLGRQIRAILLDSANSELDPIAELLLYFASRVQNLEQVIKPALAEGYIVISDRFTDATVAYQGYGRSLGQRRVMQLSEFSCPGVKPDLTIWLDVEPSTAVSRARSRNEKQTVDESLMESQSMRFFNRVRSGYAAICKAEPERMKRVDANGSVGQVTRRVLDLLLPALRASGHRDPP